jgi:hypothetical protein
LNASLIPSLAEIPSLAVSPVVESIVSSVSESLVSSLVELEMPPVVESSVFSSILFPDISPIDSLSFNPSFDSLPTDPSIIDVIIDKSLKSPVQDESFGDSPNFEQVPIFEPDSLEDISQFIKDHQTELDKFKMIQIILPESFYKHLQSDKYVEDLMKVQIGEFRILQQFYQDKGNNLYYYNPVEADDTKYLSDLSRESFNFSFKDENEIWNRILNSASPFYALNINGSCMKDKLFYESMFKDDSLIQKKEKFIGINLPELFIGENFSSFTPHEEDYNLLSLSFLMSPNTSKIWYSVPDVDAFQRLLKMKIKETFPKNKKQKRICPGELQHRNWIFNPFYLAKTQKVYQSVQIPKSLIVTSGVHFGFNVGKCCSEAINVSSKNQRQNEKCKCSLFKTSFTL